MISMNFVLQRRMFLISQTKLFPITPITMAGLVRHSKMPVMRLCLTIGIGTHSIDYEKVSFDEAERLFENPSSQLGSLELAKSVVAETLTKRIERGLLTEELAFDIAKRIFRTNAIEVFQLKEKLGISPD